MIIIVISSTLRNFYIHRRIAFFCHIRGTHIMSLRDSTVKIYFKTIIAFEFYKEFYSTPTPQHAVATATKVPYVDVFCMIFHYKIFNDFIYYMTKIQHYYVRQKHGGLKVSSIAAIGLSSAANNFSASWYSLRNALLKLDELQQYSYRIAKNIHRTTNGYLSTFSLPPFVLQGNKINQ